MYITHIVLFNLNNHVMWQLLPKFINETVDLMIVKVSSAKKLTWLYVQRDVDE